MFPMKVLKGSAAVALAVKQVKPDVVVAGPITPSTSIIEEIATFVANGEMDAELLNVESEASAISSCIGASAAGGRVFTVSASQGLAMMHEILFITSSLRLPVVIGVTNGALAAPLNVCADHSDSMAQRDCGWIQVFSENVQEAYDNMIQAFKIAEHQEVRTPVMVGLDSIITSHASENVQVEEAEKIRDFVSRPAPPYSLIDTDKPRTVGSVDTPDYYFEHKVNQAQGIESSRKVIKEVGKEYGDRFGRYYGYFETYKLEDADHAVVLMSSAAGTAKEVVDRMRSQGEKVGLLKLRVFRPFPHNELRGVLSKMKSVAVLDRTLPPGAFGGPLFSEIRSALYDVDKKPIVCPYIFGLGGRDLTMDHIEAVFAEMKENVSVGRKNPQVNYINLRN